MSAAGWWRGLRSVRAWPVAARAVAITVVVELGLRVTTLPRLSAFIGVPLRLDDRPAVLGAPSPGLLDVRELRALGISERVVRRWPFGDTCLRRALVSGHLLRRRKPALRVGVAKVDGRIQAHAWLEIDGVSLDPEGSATYRTFEAMGGTR
ncbi:lasso peptide biosynthesis B2 protein [Jiangella anatolica]|uniref:lasso peptide biosynthesis B2 protein n=1 Tax=Jiangella anatolica TaxID=2670374 RepID=UPI0013140C4D|nr:lasso peptide biosynthesis B2 protein [Jiangella anatolica]